MGHKITIRSSEGERLAASYHTGPHKPFSILWKVSGNYWVDFVTAHFHQSWRAANKHPFRGQNVSGLTVNPYEITRMDGDGGIIVSPIHMCLITCEYIRYHPNCTNGQISRFMRSAFGGQGSAAVEDALRVAIAAIHDLPENPEYDCFKRQQLRAHAPDILRLRGQVVN